MSFYVLIRLLNFMFINFWCGFKVYFVVGTACLARGLSGYIDALANNVISDGLYKVMPMDIPFFSKYPDLFAFLIMVIFSGEVIFCFFSLGLKLSIWGCVPRTFHIMPYYYIGLKCYFSLTKVVSALTYTHFSLQSTKKKNE